MQSKTRTYAELMVELFDGATEAEAKKRVQRLKHILQKRGDAKRIGDILQEFAKQWKERKGSIATVVSAEPLTGSAKKSVEQSLSKQGYILEEKVDPKVLGGLALYLQNHYVIDGTIKGKLQRLVKNVTFSNG